MSKACPSCGIENGDEFRFCAGCGARFPDRPAPSPPPDATLVVRQPAPPVDRTPVSPPAPSAPSPAPPHAREAAPPDPTLVARAPHPSPPPQDRPAVAPSPPASSTPAVSPAPSSPPDATLVARVPPSTPVGAAIRASTRPSTPGTNTAPLFDTGIDPDEPVAGDATIGAFEVQLLERPAPRARQVALLRRGEYVYVLHYRGSQAAVRMPDGRAGYLPRHALSGAPSAPEHDAPEETFVTLPNVTAVRTGPAPLRAAPSRLAESLRELPVGEPVQLQTFEAFFARVRLVDGTEGYVERDQIAASGSAPVLGGQIPLRMWAVGLSGLLGFIGALLPWFKVCDFCASKAGVDGAGGWLVLLFAIAGVALLFAPRSFPQVPENNFRVGGAATGALIVLTAIITKANHDGSMQFGLYLTIVAGIALAAAPWADELAARLREGTRT